MVPLFQYVSSVTSASHTGWYSIYGWCQVAKTSRWRNLKVIRDTAIIMNSQSKDLNILL